MSSKLKLSYDRKVSPSSVAQKAGWKPNIPNAFGLPAHLSCPGKTAVCEQICYAWRSEKVFKGVKGAMMHNWEVLRALGDNVDAIQDTLEEMLREYQRILKMRRNKDGIEYPDAFRIHWDGDFYSKPYAQAWARAMASFPSTRFWVYTRSFDPAKLDVIPQLAKVENLSLYLSCDDANKAKAPRVLRKYPDVRIAMLGESFELAQESTIVALGKRAPKCPEQTGRYPLVGEDGTGACIACNMCPESKNHVLFSMTKK